MDENGELLDIYEQTTMSTDDGWTTGKSFAPALSIDECIELGKGQADNAIDRFNSVYHPYFHPLATRPAPRSVQRWLEAMLGHCTERGHHFVDGTGWVEFNDAKQALRMAEYDFDYDSTTLSVTARGRFRGEGGDAGTAVHLQGRRRVVGYHGRGVRRSLLAAARGPRAGPIVGRLLGRRVAPVAHKVGQLVAVIPAL